MARTKTPTPSPPARARRLPKEANDVIVLWTARAIVHTDTFRYFLHDDGDDRSPLDVIGLGHLRDEGVTPTRAKREIRDRLVALEKGAVTRDGVLFRNVETMGRLLSLTRAEQEVLAFAIVLDIQKSLQACFERLEGLSLRKLHELLGQVLGLPETDVRDALRRSAPLASTGLVRVATDVRRTWDDPFEVMDGLENILLTEYEAPEAILANFFRQSPAAKLTLEDFPHAKQDVGILVKFLQGAIEKQVPGVNVLLHGLPGTGKTELARAVAAHLNGQLYEVNVESDDGSAISGTGRFAAYQLCQRMLGRRSQTIVLFDEIEDVFPDRWYPFFGRQKRSGEDKGWTNRLLEGNAVPTMWLSNEIGQIDSAFLRRFDFIFELRTPPLAVRRRILEKQLGPLPARPAWTQRMAHDERLTPAHIERAVRVARLAGMEKAEEVEATLTRVLQNSLAVQSPERPAAPVTPEVYDLRFLNASDDLGKLVETLERRSREQGPLHGSICLYGPPGTGKTAFAHHLAERVQRPLLVKRASDILGPFVGQTEANLAAMFRQARDEGAVLLLDEADSFFQNRRGASQNWEVTQVNELLVQMESFEGLFVCSTNLFEHLDEASLRRFTLKIKFDPLRPEQRMALFERTLEALGQGLPADAVTATRTALDQLHTLTPGDFATVRRQALLLETTVDARALLTALERECRNKPNAQRSRLGFNQA